jgi:hypothetical protein
MRRVLAARPAELVELQPARRGLLVLGGGVIAILAITALQRNNLSRHFDNPFRLPRGWVPRSLVRVLARISVKRFRFAENLCCPKAYALNKSVSPLKGLYLYLTLYPALRFVLGCHLFRAQGAIALPNPGAPF